VDLILWRHADTREADPDLDAFQRPLTAKGERQAHRMAQWLNRHLADTTRVLASPSLPARQTADALNRKYKIVPELAPERTVMELLQAVRWPDARGPVLVVGHQPTLGLAAAYLLDGNTSAWRIRKGSAWWLRRRERDGTAEVMLIAVLSAELI
jgi:phosphohistidine phosphatase